MYFFTAVICFDLFFYFWLKTILLQAGNLLRRAPASAADASQLVVFACCYCLIFPLYCLASFSDIERQYKCNNPGAPGKHLSRLQYEDD